jgi:NADH:ubiquinone oxidoreductase subunit 2 (subunit N)
VALLGSAIGAFYYLRAVYALYLLPDPDGVDTGPVPSAFSILAYAVVLAALGTAVAGIVPRHLIELAAQAVLG